MMRWRTRVLHTAPDVLWGEDQSWAPRPLRSGVTRDWEFGVGGERPNVGLGCTRSIRSRFVLFWTLQNRSNRPYGNKIHIILVYITKNEKVFLYVHDVPVASIAI